MTGGAESADLTAIVAAMREEIAPLLARTRVQDRLRVGRCPVVRGSLGDVPVLIARTGDGRQAAAAGMAALLDRFPVKRVVTVGISGGLSPALSPGALLVARVIRDGDTTAPAPDPEWVDRAGRITGIQVGTVVSSERILSSAADKEAAWKELKTEGPAAVDLESAAYAREAAARGIPFVVLRAICDPAQENLPFDLDRCRDREGRIRRGRVLAHALLRPRYLAHLWNLRARVASAAERLARLVEVLLNGESG